MKKNIYITITIILIVIIMLLVIINIFKSIEKENGEYYSKRSQIEEIFYGNTDKLKKLADELYPGENIISFQYNSNFNNDQIYSQFGYGEASEIILFLIDKYKFTNIDTGYGYLTVYQYPPIIYSDICIGVQYDYNKKQWKYYYQHDYKHCRHCYKKIYRLYDWMYNSSSIL